MPLPFPPSTSRREFRPDARARGPLPRRQAAALVALRHVEWVEFQAVWRWLADSLEGGRRYRLADYTIDPIAAALGSPLSAAQRWPSAADVLADAPRGPSYGSVSERNLVPHLSETGPDGADQYALRLARTPVPRLLDRALARHLGKVFGKEVRRDGPPALAGWWADVDGRGTPMGDWIQEDVGPLFLALGQVDLLFTAPAAPAGVDLLTRADELAYRLDRCVASVVLPENVVWWELEPSGRYRQALVFDRFGAGDSGPLFWHWTAAEVQAYRPDGAHAAEVSGPHPFGRAPLVRVFARRLARCRNVGVSAYESIAEAQKATYNLESERYLSDVQQSHALLQGPEDYVQNSDAIPVGPGNLLPKKKSTSGASVTYEGWEYADPPKGAQEAIRQHVLDCRDEADRDAALTKPAGQTTQATVSQSGISKIADQADAGALLSKVAARLERLETAAAEFALAVATAGAVGDGGGATVVYPRQFDLDTVGDVGLVLDQVQRGAQQMGALPRTEAELLKRSVLLGLPGLPPERIAELAREIDDLAARAARDPGADQDHEHDREREPVEDAS